MWQERAGADVACGAPERAGEGSASAAEGAGGSAPSDPLSERPLRELEFVTPPFAHQLFGRGFVELAAIGLSATASAGVASGEFTLYGVLLALGAFLLYVLAVLSFRYLRLRHCPPQSTVQLFHDYVLAPASAGSDNIHRLDYAKLLSLTVVGSGPRARLWTGTSDHLVRYFADDWRAPASNEAFAAEVRQRIAALPEGAALLGGLDARNTIANEAWQRMPRASMALIASLVAVFAGCELAGVGDDAFGLLRFGANSGVLVAGGQLYRLCAANFLHANVVHLAFNCLGLWSLGSIVERLLGPTRFLSIYLASALTGSIASAALSGAAVAIGASTAVFGLLGALAVLNFRYRRDLPVGFRLPRVTWIITLLSNVIVPLTAPQIDGAGHAGGFLGGALIAALSCWHPAFDIARPVARWAQLGPALLLGLFIPSLAQAGWRSVDRSIPDVLPLARATNEDPHASPELLNGLAWHYARQPRATEEELAVAKRAIERAAALTPDEPNVQDTLATVWFRLHELDRALLIERQLLSTSTDAAFYAQAARFLAERSRVLGPLEQGDGAQVARLHARVSAPDADGQRTLTLDVANSYPHGAEAWLLGLVDDQLQGYCLLRLPPGTGPGVQQLTLPSRAAGDPVAIWPTASSSELGVALLDTRRCEACFPAEAPHCAAVAEELPR